MGIKEESLIIDGEDFFFLNVNVKLGGGGIESSFDLVRFCRIWLK